MFIDYVVKKVQLTSFDTVISSEWLKYFITLIIEINITNSNIFMLIHDFVLKNMIKHNIRMNTGCGYNCG